MMGIVTRYFSWWRKVCLDHYTKQLSLCAPEVQKVCESLMMWLSSNCSTNSIIVSNYSRSTRMGHEERYVFTCIFYDLDLSVVKFIGEDAPSFLSGTYFNVHKCAVGEDVPLSKVDKQCLKYVFKQYIKYTDV